MKPIIVLILLAASAAANAEGSFDCDDLRGWWQGERFDQEIGAQTKETSVLTADGRIFITFEVDDGQLKQTQYESGRWACDGNRLTTFIDTVNGQPTTFIAIYKINELNSVYFNYTLESADCSLVGGACLGTVYENVRIEPPEFDGCC